MNANNIALPPQRDGLGESDLIAISGSVVEAAHHVAAHLAVDIVAGRRPRSVWLWYAFEAREGFMCHEDRSRIKDVSLRALAGPAAHALWLWEVDGAPVVDLVTELQTRKLNELVHPKSGITLDSYFTSAVRNGGRQDYLLAESHSPCDDDDDEDLDLDLPIRDACSWVASRWGAVQRLALALLPKDGRTRRALDWKAARDLMNEIKP